MSFRQFLAILRFHRFEGWNRNNSRFDRLSHPFGMGKVFPILA